MQVSYNWLKKLVDFDYDVETLTNKLTMIGTACEGIQPLAESLDNSVVVGKIVACEPVSGSEHLQVCQVEVGEAEAVTVVCGAPNVALGLKAPLALPGAVLQGKYEIKTIDKHGVQSAGMLCSEAELGLSDDQSGIMELDAGLKIGTPLIRALGLDDYVISFDLTPNRPDCLSAIGIARDIAAITGSPVKKPEAKLKEIEASAAQQVKVVIDDPEACPRYAARIIEKVKIGPSPWWIKQRLLASGIRSINNVVDITNYVMLEYGQPLHAFDYGNFSRPEVRVRRAKEGERFITLDDVERTLNEEVLLITDGERPVAIGGIMGGLDSEVGEGTTRLLLESAHFNSKVIRRGRKFLGLSSESQDRFERGADPNIVPTALDRAAALIAKYADGEVLSGCVDCYPQPVEPLQLELRPARVNQVLATDLSSPQMIDILNSLELKVAPGKTLVVTVPTFRPDITREIDLIEEIARVYGYDRIPTRMVAGGALVTKRVESELFTGQIRDVLLAQGYYEAVANSIVDPKLVKVLYPNRACVEVLNPISEDLRWMRPDLLTGLLSIVRHNLNHRVNSVKIFEIGNTFSPVADDLPKEEMRVALALSGCDSGENWTFHPGAFSFYDIKGALEAIEQLESEQIACSPATIDLFAEGQSFEIQMGGAAIGLCGKVSDVILRAMGIKQEVFAAEILFDPLLRARHQARYYRPLGKYPAADRDIAVVVDESTLISDLLGDIREAGGDKLREVTLFDVYRGKQVGSGKKSVAFRLLFQDESKTLTDEYIDNVHKNIVGRLEQRHGAELRAE